MNTPVNNRIRELSFIHAFDMARQGRGAGRLQRKAGPSPTEPRHSRPGPANCHDFTVTIPRHGPFQRGWIVPSTKRRAFTFVAGLKQLCTLPLRNTGLRPAATPTIKGVQTCQGPLLSKAAAAHRAAVRTAQSQAQVTGSTAHTNVRQRLWGKRNKTMIDFQWRCSDGNARRGRARASVLECGAVRRFVVRG